jgi:thiol-disulfide isomerase/thioredoxin
MTRLLAMLLSGFFLISCNSQPAGTIRISGHIPSDIAEIIYLRSSDSKDSITVTAGNFDQNIELQTPGFFTLEIGNSRFEIFLAPKSNLIIHVDSLSNPMNIHYSGDLGRENEYLLFNSQTASQLNYRELFIRKLDDFKLFADSLLAEKSTRMEQLNSEEDLHNDFLRLTAIKNKASHGDKLFRYPMYHAYYTKSDLPSLPSDYYSFIGSIDINDEEFYKLGEVKQYISGLLSYYSDQIIAASGKDAEQPDVAIQSELQAINEQITNQSIKNNLLYESLSSHLGYYGPAGIEPTLEYFYHFCEDTCLQIQMTQEYSEWDYLKPGKPAPKWEAINIQGEKVSSDQFLGKYLYLDIWATWCSPCRREIPYLEELAEKFNSKNVTIVSVSVDKDKEAWMKMVKEGMSGHQLFAEGAFQSDLAIQFRVNAIPRFLLIDPNGMIINVSTERPSGRIAEVLNSLPGI